MVDAAAEQPGFYQWDIPLDGTYSKSPGAVFDPNNNCARQSSCDITGGGLTENLPRVLPETLGAEIDLSAWEMPGVFTWMAETGGIETSEMLKTFNCGIGMVLVASKESEDELTALLREEGEDVHLIGEITEGQGIHYTGSLL